MVNIHEVGEMKQHYIDLALANSFKQINNQLYSKIYERVQKALNGEIDKKRTSFADILHEIETLVNERFTPDLRYLFKSGLIQRYKFALFESYVIAGIVMIKKVNSSAEEAVSQVYSTEKNLITPWKMAETQVLPGVMNVSKLLLPLFYLEQLGYNGIVKDKIKFEEISKEVQHFKGLLAEFKIMPEEEFDKLK